MRKRSCAVTFMVMYFREVEPIHLHSLEFRNVAFQKPEKELKLERNKKNDKPFTLPHCQTVFHSFARIWMEALWIVCVYIMRLRRVYWMTKCGDEEGTDRPMTELYQTKHTDRLLACSFGHGDFKAINNSQLSWHSHTHNMSTMPRNMYIFQKFMNRSVITCHCSVFLYTVWHLFTHSHTRIPWYHLTLERFQTKWKLNIRDRQLVTIKCWINHSKAIKQEKSHECSMASIRICGVGSHWAWPGLVV